MNNELIEESRALFEMKVYMQAFIKAVRFEPGKQFFQLDPDKPTKAVMFERSTEHPEDYKDEHISAMWFGWRLALKQGMT